MTDHELVERARAGSPDAFGTIVERHRGTVYRAALAALRREADAEDVAQEALVLAYRRLDQFRGDASLRTWLVRIAWRLALSRRRRATWWGLASLGHATGEGHDHGTVPDPGDPGRSAERRLLDAEHLRLVSRMVRALPRRYRDPLLLIATGDLSYEQVAEILHVKIGTLKWRVAEARRQLRARLDRYGFPS